MVKPLTILCVHGVGHAELDPMFRDRWNDAILAGVRALRPDQPVTLEFFQYDTLFEHAPLNPGVYEKAFTRLLASAAVHGIIDLLTARRALADLPAAIRWTAGMVAQWSAEDDLRAAARARLLAQLAGRTYDLVCAHSLGSLIAYDTFARQPDAIAGTVLATLGSQIGHPAVRDVFAGRISGLRRASHWYHLFNPHDHVLTRPLSVPDGNFSQLTTTFDLPNDILNHDAAAYLRHANTIAGLWRPLLGGRGAARAIAAAPRPTVPAPRAPDTRALLVGINAYPNPENRLEGCVNDAFLMSAVLQESGFKADEIRVVLDERATTDGIVERLHWLLDDVQPGDKRVFFYSGHGAQIPAYGPTEEPDHFSESLVPVDFDWTPAHSITDRQFSEFYSQLPYGAAFVAIFDCCHSGGLSRDGGPKIRGINPPDDVRHRALYWDPDEEMWRPRKFPKINPSMPSGAGRGLLGPEGTTHRLGRAAVLRTLPRQAYFRTQKALQHHGPYLPILMEACQEAGYSYEYRHGATSYGAYTYCLAEVLREGHPLSFAQLSQRVSRKLTRLQYDQVPALTGAKAQLRQRVPWHGKRRGRGARRP